MNKFEIYNNDDLLYDKYYDMLSELYYECFGSDEVWKTEKDDIYVMVDTTNDLVVASLALSRENENEASIWSVCCTEEYRRKGLAKKLITYAINDEKNAEVTTFWLLVDNNNYAAISLYSNLGFEIDPNYHASQKGDTFILSAWNVDDERWNDVFEKSNENGENGENGDGKEESEEGDENFLKMFLLRTPQIKKKNKESKEETEKEWWCNIL